LKKAKGNFPVCVKMTKKIIIDGNNLIGKIPELKSVPKSDKQFTREKLALILDRYFTGKKMKVSLHFDGFAGPAIKTASLDIHYSNSRTADDLIKSEIEYAKNPKLLTVVSSDHSLYSFAKACSCTPVKAEDFVKQLYHKNSNIEEDKIKSISSEEMKRLFNA
jgi:uncharacterized protein